MVLLMGAPGGLSGSSFSSKGPGAPSLSALSISCVPSLEGRGHILPISGPQHAHHGLAHGGASLPVAQLVRLPGQRATGLSVGLSLEPYWLVPSAWG